jgi:hypothetical protein
MHPILYDAVLAVSKVRWKFSLQIVYPSVSGHSAKNDLSMEVLRGFCTRETFLRSVPSVKGADDYCVRSVYSFHTSLFFGHRDK